MKKFSIIALCCLLIFCICKVSAKIGGENEEYYRNLSKEAINYVSKLQTCSPATFYLEKKNLKETIYGKTKNNMCHYSIENQVEKYDCVFPMQIAIGLSTTLLDTIDYAANDNTDISAERLKQFFEISLVANDYCKLYNK